MAIAECTHNGNCGEAWILHSTKRILVAYPCLGPPSEVIQSSDGTVGGTYFRADDYLGCHPVGDVFGWGELGTVAGEKADELGYSLVYMGG